MKDVLIKAVKGGMKAEMDAVILYTGAAEKSKDSEVKKFFLDRAEEEKKHYNFLLSYYEALDGMGDMSEIVVKDPAISPAISENFVKRISEDQFLFSAISTAVLLEKNGIDYYLKCVEDTKSIKALSDFFHVLVDWERKHYDELLKIQKDAEEIYWRFNSFEPF
ncbi:MAG: ferritin family protein [Candidatus Cloacimonetes bacterium]|nr:ferritin family protein [Candidatus Cloacimonadota bacterium]